MATDKALRFYLLAVCFVAMVCAAITSGMVLYGLVKIAAPELTLDSWSYSAHQSLENFRLSQYNPDNRANTAALALGPGSTRAIALNEAGRPSATAQQPDYQPISDEQLEQARQQSFQRVLANHRRSALQDLVRLSIVLLVSAALFYSHWRMARKTSASAQ